MGKWCLQASVFIFDRIFIKLAGNQDRHKILDEFEFRLDWISHLGVTCPWGQFKFSIDLLWNLQVQLTFQMKLYWVSCGRYSSYSFPPIVLKLFRSLLHGMKMCMWFGYNPLIIFFSLFLLCELVFFQDEMLSKCPDNGYLVDATPLSFPSIVLKLCRCFRHGMKMCMWFGYNTLIIFSPFSVLWTYFFFFYMKCYQSV